MSAPNFTPIQLYRTATAAATPSAGNLADGELAINLTDEKLYFKNASGVVKLLASNSGSLGSVTSVNASGSTTGLTFTGGPITSSGTLTLGGTLVVGNGGTGATSLTSGYLLKGNGTSAVSSSVVYDTGTNVGIGTAAPGYKLEVQGNVYASSAINADGGINIAAGLGAYWRASLPSGAYQGGITYNGALRFYSGDVTTERVRIDTSGNVGIGTSAPNAKLDVVGNVIMGAALTTGTGVSTGDVQLELGANRTGDGSCYIDWHSTAGTDFESRIIRNSGANGTMDILNTGTGGINLSNFGSAPITLATGGIDRMRVTSTGNVGIGTTSPQARLHVRPTTDVNLWTTNDGTTLRTIAINDGVSAYINWRRDANQHTFETNGSERVRFSQTGNVGIGTTSPAQRIHAATTAAPTGTTQSFLRLTGDATFGADFGGGIIQGTGPIATISTVNAGTATERMRIDSSGNVGINETAPDYKLDVNGTFGFTPGSSVTPVDNGDVVFELTNNTTLTVKAKGSDGVVRSATITLA